MCGLMWGGRCAASDATLVARLGNDLPAAGAHGQAAGAAGQAAAAAERAAAGLQASTSGREQGLAGWASDAQRLGSLGKQSSTIELPPLPWSDWEIPAEQIAICKREDGSDWELGSGAFGKVSISSIQSSSKLPRFCSPMLLLHLPAQALWREFSVLWKMCAGVQGVEGRGADGGGEGPA